MKKFGLVLSAIIVSMLLIFSAFPFESDTGK